MKKHFVQFLSLIAFVSVLISCSSSTQEQAEQEYIDSMDEIIQELLDYIDELNLLNNKIALDYEYTNNEKWIEDTVDAIGGIGRTVKESRNIEPPETLESQHQTIMGAMDRFEYGIDTYAQAIRHDDEVYFIDSIDAIEEGLEIFGNIEFE